MEKQHASLRVQTRKLVEFDWKVDYAVAPDDGASFNLPQCGSSFPRQKLAHRKYVRIKIA